MGDLLRHFVLQKRNPSGCVRAGSENLFGIWHPTGIFWHLHRISLFFSLLCLASWPCVPHFFWPRDTKRQFTSVWHSTHGPWQGKLRTTTTTAAVEASTQESPASLWMQTAGMERVRDTRNKDIYAADNASSVCCTCCSYDKAVREKHPTKQ